MILVKKLYAPIGKILHVSLLVALIVGCEGPAGPAGQNGVDGNANVKAYVYNNLNWTTNDGVATANGSCAGITADIMNTGAVLGYASYTAPNSSVVEWLLPWTYTSLTYTENVLLSHSVGLWRLQNTASDDIPSVYDEIPRLKIVVIQGLAGKKEGIELNYTWEELVKRYPNMEYIYVN